MSIVNVAIMDLPILYRSLHLLLFLKVHLVPEEIMKIRDGITSNSDKVLDKSTVCIHPKFSTCHVRLKPNEFSWKC